jgi:hypothetical protein
VTVSDSVILREQKSGRPVKMKKTMMQCLCRINIDCIMLRD